MSHPFQTTDSRFDLEIVSFCAPQMSKAGQVTVALVGCVMKLATDRAKPVNKIGVGELPVSSNRCHETHFVSSLRYARRVVGVVSPRLLQRMIDKKKVGQSIGSDGQVVDWFSAFVTEF